VVQRLLHWIVVNDNARRMKPKIGPPTITPRMAITVWRERSRASLMPSAIPKVFVHRAYSISARWDLDRRQPV
jgi:hypothetical protein